MVIREDGVIDVAKRPYKECAEQTGISEESLYEWAAEVMEHQIEEMEASHAALVARMRAAIRWLSDAYNGEYGDGPSSNSRIEEEVTPLQPGDLGEGDDR